MSRTFQHGFVVSLFLVCCWWRTCPARGEILVVNQSNGNNGTGTVRTFTPTGSTAAGPSINGLNRPAGIALSDGNTYVANQNTGTIGEYTSSGSAVNASLISGLSLPDHLAVSGSTLFVTNLLTGTVGEYTTSGAVINASLISGLHSPSGIAVWGDDLYVASRTDGTIAKYTTSGVLQNAALITGLSQPEGIAVSGNDLYVANGSGSRAVGKYTTSGGSTNAAFIPSSSLGFGGSTPRGVVVAGSNVYVTSSGNGGNALSKFKTSGQVVSSNLVAQSTLDAPWGVTLPRTVADLQHPFSLDTIPQTLDNQAIVTAILSQPGTVNGFTYSNHAFLVQDRTGSLQVFSTLNGVGYTPTVGDEINVTGTYARSLQTGQMPELTSITEVNRISSGNAVPDPIVTTIPDLNKSPMPLGAPAPPAVGEYLFTLENVTITGAPGTTWGHGATGNAANETMTITDADGNSLKLFYWPSSYSLDAAFYDQPIPTGPVDMTGFVHIFSGAEFTPISITPVPEPGALTLLTIGALLSACHRRKKIRKANGDIQN